MEKLIITVAPNAHPAKLDAHPELPRTPDQIAAEVIAACKAGAAVAHLHVVDERGYATEDLSAFRSTIWQIRNGCDIVIEGSTGGMSDLGPAGRCVALQADIELASLNPGSVNYDESVYLNSPSDIDYWVQQMQKRGIKPAIAVFDSAFIANAMEYIRQGLIATPALFNFVLGLRGAIPAEPRTMVFLSESLPADSFWGVIGYADCSLITSVWSLSMGGHARAGFEDNFEYLPGQPARSNAQLVERLVRISREVGREVATPSEARQMLRLPAR